MNNDEMELAQRATTALERIAKALELQLLWTTTTPEVLRIVAKARREGYADHEAPRD